jgi:hypothetical protein
MNKSMLVVVLALSAALGACATTPNDDIVAEVQTITTTACSFVPTADTIIALVGSGPTLTTAAAIADAICAAVTPKLASSKRRATPPTVNGIVIHGSFVR